MQLFKLIITLATATSIVALTGCSGAPSASEVEKAMRASVDEASAQMSQLKQGGVDMSSLIPTLHSVNLVGCAQAQGEAGYNCDVEFEISTQKTGKIQGVEKRRYVKGSNGWVDMGKV